jgi:hypothetical protein
LELNRRLPVARAEVVSAWLVERGTETVAVASPLQRADRALERESGARRFRSVEVVPQGTEG